MARHLLTLRVNASLADISFPPEGATLFLLTLDNRLLSLDASAVGDGAPVLRHEWTAPEGRVVVAAGWIERRVAIASVGEGELQLSHGASDPESGASSTACLKLAGTGLHFPGVPSPRFDPYVRWWQEIDPIEQGVTAVSLLRDAREHLFATAVWQEDGQQRTRVTLVADQVRGLVGRDMRHSVAFTGTVAGAPGVFALDRRSHAPIPLQHLPGDASCRTFFAWSDTSDSSGSHLLWAVEQAPNTWVLNGTHAPRTVALTAGEQAVGLTALPSEEPALVVLGPDRRDLCLIRAGIRTHQFTAPAAITQVAAHPTRPLLACLAFDNVSLLSLD